MLIASTAGELQAWIAVVGGLLTVLLTVFRYFNVRSRRDRAAAAGALFSATVAALADESETKRLAGAIVLRRFYARSTEQGGKRLPYAAEALGVTAAVLRGLDEGHLQKTLADGLAFAPGLAHADLQRCNLRNAYLGVRPDRCPDLSDADLFGADLSDASLKGARAQRAVFFRATLCRTVFSGADLEGADFRDAELTGARFDGARLMRARFAGAKNIPEDVQRLLAEDGEVPAASELAPGRPASRST